MLTPPPVGAGQGAIGVFDSGVGGLHVLAALRRALPGRETIYLGDAARLPYGSKSAAVVRAYARRCAERLVAEGVGAVVIACNTASARADDDLAEGLGVPVLGVVAAGARAVAAAAAGGRIGVVATAGTVDSGAYPRALRRAAPAAEVVCRACPLWVPLAEEDMAGHPATRLIVAGDLAAVLAAGIDALLLGCTHYPLLRPLIDELAGPGVAVVDAAAAVAEEVAAGLGGTPPAAARPGRCRLLATDASPHLWRLGQRLLGEPLPAIERIDL